MSMMTKNMIWTKMMTTVHGCWPTHEPRPHAWQHAWSTIARGQMAVEDRAAEGDHDLLIQDTDLLSTVVYSRHYYGGCPRWIEVELGRRVPDLYVLAGIDVPWKPDGDQRDRGHLREQMQALFHDELVRRALRFVSVEGSLARRLATASAAIEELRAARG